MNIEQGKTIVKILEKRRGIPTSVHLNNNEVLYVIDIASGYDMGDEYAHITTNTSPPQDNIEINFFYVNEVKKIINIESGELVYET